MWLYNMAALYMPGETVLKQSESSFHFVQALASNITADGKERHITSIEQSSESESSWSINMY